MDKKIQVWNCKIIIFADELPPGFDNPPRSAAENAISKAGFEVIANSSGWGGTLTKSDKEWLERQGYKRRDDIYWAGRDADIDR